jgi:RimJ/RimL family protein N-acetyltransferase
MGSFLFNYLAEIARGRGVREFYARVLPENKGMLNVFESSGYPVNMEFDGEAYDIKCQIQKEE